MDKIIYPAIGHCIYCGALEYDPAQPGSKLHEEHIIQFAMNGNLVLPESSCRKCEHETHKYEGVVARTIFGDFRMRHNLRTRRRRQRPTHIQIGTKTPDGKTGVALVPIEEYHATLFPYVFKKAGIFRGQSQFDAPDPTFAYIMKSIADKSVLDRLIQKYNWDGIVRSRGEPIALARMLAKAAYSYAAAILRPGSFRVHPLLMDIILNRTDHVDFLVGGEADEFPPQANAGHVLQISYDGIVPNVLVIVGVRLFGSLPMPIYHVVVGDIDFQNAQHVLTLTEQMQNQQPIEFPLPVPKIGP